MNSSGLTNSAGRGSAGKFSAFVLVFLFGLACCYLFLRPTLLKYQTQLDQLKVAMEHVKYSYSKGQGSSVKDRELAREQTKVMVAQLQA